MGTPPATVWLALLLAGLTTAVAIRFNAYTPWGTDPAEYVAAAHRWASGAVIAPSPLALWASWSDDGRNVVPLGARPGVARGTMVSQYPLGMPVLMAAAMAVAGDAGVYLVAPLAGGLVVWCSFLLGARLAGAWGGLLAAVLVATDPILLGVSSQAMSDVPATALWTLAWALALRPGVGATTAAGLATAMAIMVRPNLAPLALVPASLFALPRLPGARGTVAWGAIATYGVTAALGPALVVWSQHVLYGSAATPGYLDWQTFYSRAFIPANVASYARFASEVHSPLWAAAFLAPVVLVRARRAPADAPATRAVVVAALAIAVINVAAYLAYTPYDHPSFLRFLLPAVVALSVLGAAATVTLCGRASRAPWRLLALAPALVVVAVHGRALPQLRDLRHLQGHVAVMGTYLREVLPPNAVLLSRLQGGAMQFYTGRPLVRLDLIGAANFDRVVDDVLAAGQQPVLLLSILEEAVGFGTHFTTSRFKALDWTPRATAPEAAGMVYYVLTDAEPRAGRARPVDVLRHGS